MDKLRSVAVLCFDEGIELIGEEGHPYCCGKRMETRSGIIGVDYAKCLECGKTIGNMASPHISGCIMSDEWFEKHRYWTWALLATVEIGGGGDRRRG